MKILIRLRAQNNNFTFHKYAFSNTQQLTNPTFVAYYDENWMTLQQNSLFRRRNLVNFYKKLVVVKIYNVFVIFFINVVRSYDHSLSINN